MKRIGTTIGFSVFLSALFVYILGKTVAVYSVTALLFFLPIGIIIGKKKGNYYILCVTLSALFAVLYCGLYTAVQIEPLKKYDKIHAQVKAEVINKEYDSGKYKTKIRILQIGDNDVYEKAVLYTNVFILAESGDVIGFDGKIYYTENYYYSSNEIRLIVKSNRNFTYKNIACKNTLRNFPQRISCLLTEAARKNMGEKEAAICSAVCYGNTSLLARDVKQSFQKSGFSHILVVSGLHMSLIYGICEGLFLVIDKRKRWVSVFTSVFIIFFMMMSGLSYSVLRSGIMILIMLFSKIIKRNSDSLNSLGLALVFIFLTNPYSVTNIGLLLSVFSTFGIVLTVNPVNEFLEKRIGEDKIILRYCISQLFYYMAASVSVMPLYAIYFKEFPLYGFIGNITLFPIIKLILYFALIGGVLDLMGAVFLGSLTLRVGGLMARVIYFVAETIEKIPYSVIPINNPYIFLFAYAAVIIVLVCFIVNKKINI